MKKIIVKNIFSSWFTFGLMLITTLIMTPIMINYLGISGYGILLLVNTLTGYMGLFDLGMQTSTTKYVAEYVAKENFDMLNRLMSTTFFLFSGIAIIVFVFTSILAFYSTNFFHIPVEYREIAPSVILILGSQISITFIFAVIVQLFSGIQRYEVHAMIEAIVLILKYSIMYIFLRNGFGLLAVALIIFSATIGEKALYLLFLKSSKIKVKLRFRYFDKSILKKIVRYSSTSFILTAASKVIYFTDNIIIGAMLSVSGVSVYGIAGRLVQNLRDFIGGATSTISPAASYANETERVNLRPIAFHSTKYIAVLIFPMVAGFILLGKDFLDIWLGKGFLESYEILVILSIGQAFTLPLSGIGAMLYGISNHKILAKAMVAEALINLSLSLLLVQDFGLPGVALGTVIPSIIFNFLILPRKTTQFFNLKLSEYYLKCLLKPLLMTIPFAATILCYLFFITVDNWIKLIFGVLISVFIYVVVLYFFDFRRLINLRGQSIWQMLSNLRTEMHL
jgi:O-antigen/teichoic acid export membrane protein